MSLERPATERLVVEMGDHDEQPIHDLLMTCARFGAGSIADGIGHIAEALES